MLRALLQYFRPYRARLIPVFLASILETCFNAGIPLSVKFIIDRALVDRNQRMLLLIIAALAAGAVIVSVTSLGRDYLYAKIVGQIVQSVRQRMFEHLQRLSMAFYARAEAGDVMSRFSNDVSAVETGLAAGVSWGLQPLLDLLLSAVLVFLLEWRLALIGIVMCPLCILGPRLFAKKATDASVAKQEHESRIMSLLQETLTAPAVVRAFNLQDTVIDRFRGRNQRLFGAGLRMGLLTSIMERSANFGTLFLQVVVMGISGYLTFLGVITVGTFAAFQTLFVSLSYSFMYLAQYTPNLVNATGGMIHMEELLKEKPGVEEPAVTVDLSPLREALEFRDVHFSYTRDRRNLDDVSLTISSGTSVAFVGPSGSGKSTMLNLLLRFYDPDSGAVLYDGTDLRQAKQTSLRAQTSVVFQENTLFNASIRENIRMAKPGAGDAEVEAAARAAEIHDFIVSLPQSYDTLCGERGGRFSGGQRQRIAIARAMLRNPSILLLDEATSALDPATEQALNTTFDCLARGRTMISVTHRLRTVVNMDRIFVLDRGTIAESGTHRELLSNNGLYAHLWQKQNGVHVDADTGRATVDESLLAEIPLLARTSPATRTALKAWFRTERFNDGYQIILQGDAGDRLYIIARGTVEVLRDNAKQLLAKLGDGDYFGEMALLSNEPRNATVRAVGPCVCLSLERDRFQQLLIEEPGLRREIEQMAAARAGAQA
ncbi:MAG TPA: ABC transporter transmembrane domain-containing protein [Bryobacteraceae bacterium]|nr:ABC transporter transmembrane domain-containing protein [Bryobacteraceae bacterium]